MTATPAITPPAMAPTFGPLCDDVVIGVVVVVSTMQDVDGHASHDTADTEHT
jgi:hypothetical protein